MSTTVDEEFETLEYGRDDSFARVRLHFRGDSHRGFELRRNGAPWLRLGPGYRALETIACGVCATDLERRFLPFRLPQVTGHEIVARDSAGRRVVVEINASPRARGIAPRCVDCADGLARHCPRRLVLGIHDLPGGFGPCILAPEHAILPVPDRLPTDTAVLVEPFAAALRAVERIAPRPHESVAVLGPRRLGMLVIAALAADRRRRGIAFEIVALIRRPGLAAIAAAAGADRVVGVDDGGAGLVTGAFDVVVDTTGSPAGLELACRLARREVHVKSTHGRPAAGLGDPTAMVVDELGVSCFAADQLPIAPGGRLPRVAWLSRHAVPATWSDATELLRGSDRDRLAVIGLRDRLGRVPGGCLVGADAVVVDDFASVDLAVRPSADSASGLVRPAGRLLVTEPPRDTALGAALARGVRLGSSRCGDFATALAMLAEDPRLRRLGASLVTHHLPARRLADAFRIARSAACLKAVVHHRRDGSPVG